MAYDNRLEQRIDALAAPWPTLTKRKMFGGIGYLQQGNFTFGIWKRSLVVRCGPERQPALMGERFTSRFAVTGRPMKGWLLIDPQGFADQPALQRWLTVGWEYASALPPKGMPE